VHFQHFFLVWVRLLGWSKPKWPSDPTRSRPNSKDELNKTRPSDGTQLGEWAVKL